MKVVKKNSDGAGSDNDMERIKQVGSYIYCIFEHTISSNSITNSKALCHDFFIKEY